MEKWYFELFHVFAQNDSACLHVSRVGSHSAQSVVVVIVVVDDDDDVVVFALFCFILFCFVGRDKRLS